MTDFAYDRGKCTYPRVSVILSFGLGTNCTIRTHVNAAKLAQSSVNYVKTRALPPTTYTDCYLMLITFASGWTSNISTHWIFHTALYSQEHQCEELCESDGTCRIDKAENAISSVFQYLLAVLLVLIQELLVTSKRQLPCAVPIPIGRLKHEGKHVHGLEEDLFHFCAHRYDSYLTSSVPGLTRLG